MTKLLKEFVAIALLTALGSVFSMLSGLAPLPWAEPEVQAGEIRIEDARVLDVIWVDARSEAEFEEGHAPGAIFYDEANPLESVGDVLERWLISPQVIVVYCTDEGCGKSKAVAEELRGNLPDAEIYSLKGGWAAWSN